MGKEKRKGELYENKESSLTGMVALHEDKSYLLTAHDCVFTQKVLSAPSPFVSGELFF
jgi:hypothetical protein